MAMWENVENTGVKEQAQTSIRRDPTGRKKSRPKKQSNLLDCMQKAMLEMSVAGVINLN